MPSQGHVARNRRRKVQALLANDRFTQEGVRAGKRNPRPVSTPRPTPITSAFSSRSLSVPEIQRMTRVIEALGKKRLMSKKN